MKESQAASGGEIRPALRAAAAEALERLRADRRVRYADVRFVGTDREALRLQNGTPETVLRARSAGFGIRALVQDGGRGAWGFACTERPEAASVVAAALRALDVAAASSRLSCEPVRWRDAPAHRGVYRTRCAELPSDVPVERKLSDLEAAARSLGPLDQGVHATEARYDGWHIRKLLVSTEGTDVEQELVYTSSSMAAFAVSDEGVTQRRSFPTYVDGDAGQGGYERIARIGMTAEGRRVREEALALLRAPQLPAGRRDLVLEGSQLALQIHESCGHPTELDRALGTEVSLAGGSFLTPDKLGSYRYGSPLVDLTADSLRPGGLGTFGYDDEGTPACSEPLVREGIFCGYLSSRETAARIGRASSATMRADSWNRAPLIRMVNVSLEPRSGTLDALLADSDGALLLETNKSWSIDDLRLHFQFGCEVAWEIRGGRKARMFRDPVYSGTTPSFWRSCDAITGPEEWRLWGVANCGKGEPMQLMHVGHGACPSRFRDVEVGHG